MLFMGEEFGASTPWQFFTDHQHEALVKSIREGRQAEFAEHGWSHPGAGPAGSGHGRGLHVELARGGSGRARTTAGVVPHLIRLRRQLPDLRSANLGEGSLARVDDLLLVRRGEVNLLANLGDQPGSLAVALDAELLASFGEVALDDGEVQLGPTSVGLLLAPPPTGTIPVVITD